MYRYAGHPCFDHFTVKTCFDFVTDFRQIALADLKFGFPFTGLSVTLFLD
jgi:hypothetical protein